MVRNAAPSSLTLAEGRLRLRNGMWPEPITQSDDLRWGQRARERGIRRARYVRVAAVWNRGGDAETVENGRGIGACLLAFVLEVVWMREERREEAECWLFMQLEDVCALQPYR